MLYPDGRTPLLAEGLIVRAKCMVGSIVAAVTMGDYNEVTGVYDMSVTLPEAGALSHVSGNVDGQLSVSVRVGGIMETTGKSLPIVLQHIDIRYRRFNPVTLLMLLPCQNQLMYVRAMFN